jgi:hypothetical protein
MAVQQRLYIFQALLGTFIPLGVTAYYISIYCFWIRKSEYYDDVATGPSNCRAVFYSWFVIAVFALSQAEYSLAGTEAGMLMSWSGHKLGQRDIIRLHADKTWSGLAGWLKALRLFCSSDRPKMWSSWLILSLAMLAAYVAVPLSGLTMELESGFVLGSEAAAVLGVTSSTFNQTDSLLSFQRALSAWKSAKNERPPGRGVIYTRERGPNSIGSLSADSVPEIFIAPQSDDIVSGKTWGLAASYDCSVLTSVEDFKLYKYKNDTKPYGEIPGLSYWEGPGGERDRNFFFTRDWAEFKNVRARMDIATSFTVDRVFVTPEYRPQSFQRWDGPDDQVPEIEILQYPGLDDPITIEIVLWQDISVPSGDFGGPTVTIVNDVGPRIPELADYEDFVNNPFPAIGVSCTCGSAVGSATIDGFRQRFTDFSRENITFLTIVDGDPFEPSWHSLAILPFGTLMLLLQGETGTFLDTTDLISGLYASASADESVVHRGGPFTNTSTGLPKRSRGLCLRMACDGAYYRPLGRTPPSSCTVATRALGSPPQRADG